MIGKLTDEEKSEIAGLNEADHLKTIESIITARLEAQKVKIFGKVIEVCDMKDYREVILQDGDAETETICQDLTGEFDQIICNCDNCPLLKGGE